MSGKKDCKFCDKNGLLWLPLRYSAVSSDDPEALKALPEIGGEKLGKNVVDLKLTHSKYAVRLLHPGYLYLLLERSEIKYWDAYQVLNDAYLFKFNADSPPQIEPEFSCDPTSCGLNASMVSIPEATNVQNIWAIYTHAPLTKAKLSEYKANADAYTSDGKMQTFNPASWLSGQTDQSHSLLASELLKTVAEYVLFTQPGNPLATPLGKALHEQLFPAIDAAYAGAPPNEKGVYGGRLGALQNFIQRNGYAALVLYDHVGVTQELNDHRNDAFQPIDDFMGRTEGAGPNNTRKFDVYHKIAEWRKLMEQGLVTDATNSVEQADIRRRAEREPPFCDDTKEMRTLKYGSVSNGIAPTPGDYLKYPARAKWEADNQKLVEEFEQYRQYDEDMYIEFADNKAKKDWQNRYSPQLDLDEMDKFIFKMNAISKKSKTEANKRAAQHISWLKSSRLLRAFDICDQNDVVSGEALSAQVFQCIFGMEGSTEAECILTEWATATKIKRENLFLRAFTRDQSGVKKEANKALTEVTEEVTGTTEFSTMPVTRWNTAIKGLVSAVKSADSALDEWMRNQGQNKNYLNPKHIANVEARCFYFVSTLTRAVARKGIGGKIETAFVARANTLMIAFLGDLAHKIEHDTLNAKIDPSKWNDLKQKHARAEVQARAASDRKSALQKRAYRQAMRTKAALENAAIDLIADAQLKAKLQIANGAKSLGWNALQTQLEESAKRHQNYKDAAKELERKTLPHERVPVTPCPTNNYHQVRLGGVLAGIETLALLGKIHSLKEIGFNMATAEVTASACSLSSILADMMYAHTKSVRELPNYASFDGINKGGEIVRGGFKVTAGLLAAYAGGVTAYLDWQAMEKQIDPFQKAILISRTAVGASSTIIGLLAAYSYSGPLLKHLAEKEGRSVFLSSVYKITGQGAFALSKRVFLLRAVAWLGWVGVIITVVDLAYSGYRSYVNYMATIRWLSRCTFRKVKTNKGFSTEKEELKEFEKAQHPEQDDEHAKKSPRKQLICLFFKCGNNQMSKQKKSQLFTVEGTIQSLHIAPGIVNLVKDIQKDAFFTGAVAGLVGQAGMLANSACLVMYEGEDVEHVALLINDQLAIGTFEWLQDLNVGDDVKLVVSKTDEGPLFVHAILRKNDHLLWTPFSVDHTRRGWILHSVKLTALTLILTGLMFGSFFIFDKEMRPDGQELVWLIIFSIVIMTFVMFMSTSGVMHLGEQAEDIFCALEVPKFERFRIKPYSVGNLHFIEDPNSLKKGHIFQFADALAAHKRKFDLP